MKKTVEERFWKHVRKTETCWLWDGVKPNNYGNMRISGKMVHAHRYSYELHYGPIPDGLDVLHNCPDGDCPACVNPAHLWLGTDKDNARDRENKGRGRDSRGEKSGNSKLTDEKVQEVFIDSETGMTIRKIAKKHGVSKSLIWSVLNKKHWSHLWP